MRDPKSLVFSMRAQLKATNRTLSLLFGRDEKTVNNYKQDRVIPDSAASWLRRVESISAHPGYAVIVIDMPADTKSGEYRRDRAKNDKRRTESNAP